jgi:hypothetical protein
MRTAIRYWGVLGTVALTELAAHFLSLGWGLMFLLAAFAWTALSGASVAAKARSTEDRVNALVPVVGTAAAQAANAFPKTGGTVSGSVTVTGSHTVNGQVNANTLSVSGNATTSGNHTVHGSLISDNSVSAGGSVSGSNFSGGSIHVSGNAQADGTIFSGSFSGGSIHVSGNALADGSFGASNFSGSYHGGQGGVSTVSGAPGSYSSSYETSLASAINGIINRLNSAGIT